MISSQGFPRNLVRGAKAPAAHDAASYLGANEKMAALLPAVKRMAQLQKACAAILPEMFGYCEVLQCNADQLVLGVPNASVAAKLKNRLPKLQDALASQGWQLAAIRLKIQVGANVLPAPLPVKQLRLPQEAVSALASLGGTLEDSPRNAALRSAIAALVERHRK
jgi:hypothetical protein